MMRRRLAGYLLLCTVVLFAAWPARAHHSILAGFDIKSTVTVTGTVTKMEWRNPHALLTIDVKNAQGQIESWSVWFGSSNGMYRRGWRADDLPVGAVVTVTGYPARDGSHQTYGGETKLADGRVLFGGEAPSEAPTSVLPAAK
jgi:hypothetical protein